MSLSLGKDLPSIKALCRDNCPSRSSSSRSATLLFIFNMISRKAGDAVDNARGLANLPRRLRWQALIDAIEAKLLQAVPACSGWTA